MRNILTIALVTTSLATAAPASQTFISSTDLNLKSTEALILKAPSPEALPVKDDKADKKARKARKEQEKRAKKAAKERQKAIKKARKEQKKAYKEAAKEQEKAIKEARKDTKKALKKLEKRGVRIDRNSDANRLRVQDLLSATAPQDRDLALLARTALLGMLTPDIRIGEIAPEELVTYRNCPPGLAKKDPPCVPPGLAKNGVTYHEWVSYDEARLDDVWQNRRGDYLAERAPLPEDVDTLLLTSAQIEDLFDLEPAADGFRYGLIDGMPVLLEQQDHESLLLINELATPVVLPDGLTVAPTAALTQQELIRLYRIAEPEAGRSYAVVNGQLISLEDSAYETLQLIRVARAAL